MIRDMTPQGLSVCDPTAIMSPLESSHPRVALVVPTFEAGATWPAFTQAVQGQVGVDMTVWVVDSNSKDGTLGQAQSCAWNTLSLGERAFNHGGTRQWAIERIEADVEFVVLMTQDALLATPDALCRLLKPFANESVGAVYGRQLPHADATLLAAQARFFNYPNSSFVNTFEDRARLGLKAAFCSNSFAAYRLTHFKAVGGFPKHVIMGEDMWVAARMLMAGFKVAYASEALVYHSHNHSFKEEFQRYFDTGVFHAQAPWLLENFGSVKSEGLKMLKAQLLLAVTRSSTRGEPITNWVQGVQPSLEEPTDSAHAVLLKCQERFDEQIELIASSGMKQGIKQVLMALEVLIRMAIKLIAYRLGRAYRSLPAAWVTRWSSHKAYWPENDR